MYNLLRRDSVVVLPITTAWYLFSMSPRHINDNNFEVSSELSVNIKSDHKSLLASQFQFIRATGLIVIFYFRLFYYYAIYSNHIVLFLEYVMIL